MEGERAQIRAQQICPRPAGLVGPAAERTPASVGARSPAPAWTPGLQRQRGAGRVLPVLAYHQTLDQDCGSSLPLFCPLAQPRKGLCTPSTHAPYGGLMGTSLLWVNRLSPMSPPTPVQRATGRFRLGSRWGRRRVASSCSENATANWNHVVRIKSRSPSFLSLIRGALFIRAKGSSEIFIC